MDIFLHRMGTKSSKVNGLSKVLVQIPSVHHIEGDWNSTDIIHLTSAMMQVSTALKLLKSSCFSFDLEVE